MKDNYFMPVSLKNITLHGDFCSSDPTVSVIRVKNMHVTRQIPVVTCEDPEGFKDETGYDYSDELFIRSNLMLFKGFEYDVERVNWVEENEACKYAVERNEEMPELGMTFAFDQDVDCLIEEDTTKHYEFRLPHELLLALPVDLDESQYCSIEAYPDVYKDFISHLAWRQMLTTLPIYDIKEVNND